MKNFLKLFKQPKPKAEEQPKPNVEKLTISKEVLEIMKKPKPELK